MTLNVLPSLNMKQVEPSQAVEFDGPFLEQLRKLEPLALTQVYNRFHTPVFKYISFRVDNVQLAEDLTSDVFSKLLEALKSNKMPQQLEGWLFGVARNLVKMHYRKKSRWKFSFLTERLSDSAESLDTQISEKMNLRQLQQQIQGLNEQQQHVLGLRFGYGMSIKEVAKQLGKSEGAIKMLQARAIASLSKGWEE